MKEMEIALAKKALLVQTAACEANANLIAFLSEEERRKWVTVSKRFAEAKRLIEELMRPVEEEEKDAEASVSSEPPSHARSATGTIPKIPKRKVASPPSPELKEQDFKKIKLELKEEDEASKTYFVVEEAIVEPQEEPKSSTGQKKQKKASKIPVWQGIRRKLIFNSPNKSGDLSSISNSDEEMASFPKIEPKIEEKIELAIDGLNKMPEKTDGRPELALQLQSAKVEDLPAQKSPKVEAIDVSNMPKTAEDLSSLANPEEEIQKILEELIRSAEEEAKGAEIVASLEQPSCARSAGSKIPKRQVASPEPKEQDSKKVKLEPKEEEEASKTDFVVVEAVEEPQEKPKSSTDQKKSKKASKIPVWQGIRRKLAFNSPTKSDDLSSLSNSEEETASFPKIKPKIEEKIELTFDSLSETPKQPSRKKWMLPLQFEKDEDLPAPESPKEEMTDVPNIETEFELTYEIGKDSGSPMNCEQQAGAPKADDNPTPETPNEDTIDEDLSSFANPEEEIKRILEELLRSVEVQMEVEKTPKEDAIDVPNTETEVEFVHEIDQDSDFPMNFEQQARALKVDDNLAPETSNEEAVDVPNLSKTAEDLSSFANPEEEIKSILEELICSVEVQMEAENPPKEDSIDESNTETEVKINHEIDQDSDLPKNFEQQARAPKVDDNPAPETPNEEAIDVPNFSEKADDLSNIANPEEEIKRILEELICSVEVQMEAENPPKEDAIDVSNIESEVEFVHEIDQDSDLPMNFEQQARALKVDDNLAPETSNEEAIDVPNLSKTAEDLSSFANPEEEIKRILEELICSVEVQMEAENPPKEDSIDESNTETEVESNHEIGQDSGLPTNLEHQTEAANVDVNPASETPEEETSTVELIFNRNYKSPMEPGYLPKWAQILLDNEEASEEIKRSHRGWPIKYVEKCD